MGVQGETPKARVSRKLTQTSALLHRTEGPPPKTPVWKIRQRIREHKEDWEKGQRMRHAKWAWLILTLIVAALLDEPAILVIGGVVWVTILKPWMNYLIRGGNLGETVKTIAFWIVAGLFMLVFGLYMLVPAVIVWWSAIREKPEPATRQASPAQGQGKPEANATSANVESLSKSKRYVLSLLLKGQIARLLNYVLFTRYWKERGVLWFDTRTPRWWLIGNEQGARRSSPVRSAQDVNVIQPKDRLEKLLGVAWLEIRSATESDYYYMPRAVCEEQQRLYS